MQTADVAAVTALARRHGALVVLDPTMASPFNLDVLGHADVVVNSLTKFAASEGDVIAGAVVINPAGADAEALRAGVARHVEPVYPRDLARLAAEIAGYEDLVARINQTTPHVAAFLESHPAVGDVFWSMRAETRDNYLALARTPESVGAVVSFTVKMPVERFYDRVGIPKGPSFGMTNSLLCPYLYLAHYDLVSTEAGRAELAAHGLDPSLIRLSIGLESPETIIAALDAALRCMEPMNFDTIIDRRHSDSTKWNIYAEDVLPLWTADMDFRVPEPVVEALRARAEHGVFGYCTEPAELRALLVERLARLYGWRVEPAWIIFQTGVLVSFQDVCRVAAGPAGWRARAAAGLPAHLRRAGAQRIDPPGGAAAPPRRRHVRHRLRGLRGGHHRPHARLHPLQPAQPGRPRLHAAASSSASPPSACATTCSSARTRSTATCWSPGFTHTPIASIAPEIARRTVTLMAPSKTFNVPGLRFSFAVVPDPALRRRLTKPHAADFSDVNNFGLVAATAAYRDGQPWLDALLRYLQANRDAVVDFVRRELPGDHDVMPPEATYLAWLDCRASGIPGSAYQFFLDRARVALSDGACVRHRRRGVRAAELRLPARHADGGARADEGGAGLSQPAPSITS